MAQSPLHRQAPLKHFYGLSLRHVALGSLPRKKAPLESPAMPAPQVPTKEMFREFYKQTAPWDIGKPQPPFVKVADQVTGSILDAGCGTGEHALYFASR